MVGGALNAPRAGWRSCFYRRQALPSLRSITPTRSGSPTFAANITQLSARKSRFNLDTAWQLHRSTGQHADAEIDTPKRTIRTDGANRVSGFSHRRRPHRISPSKGEVDVTLRRAARAWGRDSYHHSGHSADAQYKIGEAPARDDWISGTPVATP